MALVIPRQTEAFAFTGQAPSFTTTYTRENFLCETNTYNATSVNQNTWEMTYDMSIKNNNTVLAMPQITVLTHGLGGEAGAWSNGYSATNTSTAFAYDPDSLISKLSDQAGGADIYYAKMSQINKEDFDLRKLSINNNIYIRESKDYIDNVSNHIIVVFEANDEYEVEYLDNITLKH